MELDGRSIGKYTIKQKLGQGGMAEVFLGFDTFLEKEVAIKIIRTEIFPPVQLEKILMRFRNEAKALSKLSHPNIIDVIDFGEYDGKPYLVMPYLSGGMLKEEIGKRLDWRQAFRLLMPIANGIQYAHNKQIIHRDIKPSNILLTESGHCVLTDFGVAKIIAGEDASETLTGTGLGIGTPAYMAPEQWLGEATKESDQYSFGIVLYQLITGSVPFSASTPAAVMLKQSNEPFPNPKKVVPDLPDKVYNIILKLTAKDPNNRFPDFAAVEQAMLDVLYSSKTEPVTVKGTGFKTDPPKVFDSTGEGNKKKNLITTQISIGLGLILAFLVFSQIFKGPNANKVPTPTANDHVAVEQPTTEPVPRNSSALPEGDGVVTIFGGYGEAQGAAFQKALSEWGQANDIDVQFTSLASFDTDIKVKIEAGQEPDIAMWPQPGGLKALAEVLMPLEDMIDLKGPLSTLVPGWETIAVVDGKIYGLPVSANMKTLVFYNPSAFEANGYAVPTTGAELEALEAQIIADGSGYPWCAGIESGGATGWPFTDWLEQYVLDYNGAEAYANWVSGELDFGSPEVTKAADEVAKRLLAEGMVNGGGPAMADDWFGNTDALFANGKAEGQCFMIRQGSFLTAFLPDDIQAEVEAGDYTHIDVFPLPAPEGAMAGVIGGGDLAAVFDGHADQDVARVLEYIFSPDVLKYQVATGDLSPHKTFDLSLYPNAMQRKIGEGLANAAVFGFDASDQMTAEVNVEFWAAGTDFVAGRITWAEAAARIDSKYP